MGKAKDISGQTFGFWRAISPSDQRGVDGSILWECECLKCHKIFLINGSNLRSGHSSKGCKSCAATRQSKMKNLSGQRFGKLIAIQPTRKTETGHMVWFC